MCSAQFIGANNQESRLPRTDSEFLPDTILVSRSPGETRIALVAGEDVIELAHCRDADIQPGAVYLGRVGARVPGVGAVFVDIGAAEPGVLTLKPPFPTEGAAQPVVVVVPPRADKGCALRVEPNATWADCVRVPKLLQPAPDPIQDWWVRYSACIKRLCCEPRAEATRVATMLGADAPVEGVPVGEDLFAHHGIDEVIESALHPHVSLPCGGSVIIETTSAVTAVDVNSGSAHPSTANREAITVIAKELRRRNIAGHIVIDVIQGKGRGALPRLLARAMADDPVPFRVAGLTSLGMIELTRRRVGLSLSETFLDGNGRLSAKSVGLQGLRRAVRVAISNQAANVALTVAPEVLAMLQGELRPALAQANDLIKGDIKLSGRSDFACPRVEVHIA